MICKYFISFCVLSFHFHNSFLEAQQLFSILAEVQFKRIPIFSLMSCAFGVLYKKSLPKPGSQRFTSAFPSSLVLVLTFNSLINSEIIFVHFVRQMS